MIRFRIGIRIRVRQSKWAIRQIQCTRKSKTKEITLKYTYLPQTQVRAGQFLGSHFETLDARLSWCLCWSCWRHSHAWWDRRQCLCVRAAWRTSAVYPTTCPLRLVKHCTQAAVLLFSIYPRVQTLDHSNMYSIACTERHLYWIPFCFKGTFPA